MLITVDNITKRIANKIIIENMSISIKHGEFVGLVGKNGVGKSTLIKLLSGIILPDNGSVIVAGVNSLSIDRVSGVLGYVPQEIYLPDNITVKELVLNEAIMKGVGESEVYQAIQLAQLSEKMNTRIVKLTTGEKRKLIILKAVINNPKLLLLDEPFVGIDPVNRKQIIDYLQLLQSNGTGCVISSHYISELEQICQKLVILTNEDNSTHYKIIDNTDRTDKSVIMITLIEVDQNIINNIVDKINNQIDIASCFNKGNKVFINCHGPLDELINAALLFVVNNSISFNSITIVPQDIIEYL